jgi:hypothetical protein
MSAVPVAIDALVDRLVRRFGRSAAVIDGPPTPTATGDLVAVGLGPEDVLAVESTSSIAGLRGARESFPVLCLARSWSGNASVRDQRTRTYRLIDAVREELEADPTLGRAVTRARFAGDTYTPWRTSEGALVVDVPFTVAIDVL